MFHIYKSRFLFRLSPLPSLLAVAPRTVVTSAACAARGRNKYIKGGSNRQDLSPEAKEMIKQARDPDDMSWQLGPGIEEAITLDLTTEERSRALQYQLPYKGYAVKVNNGTDFIKYYPHKGEEIPQDPPSPVLMVTKVKTLSGEPYWVKDYCEQIGLGDGRHKSERSLKGAPRVFLPNLPSVGLLLYKIKHVVDIQPVTFPNGMPDDFDPETHGFKITPRGEFIVEGPPAESLDSIAERASWMKITKDHINQEARKHWEVPNSSPLGNHNYHRKMGHVYDYKADSEFAKNMKKKWS